jgi:hypothetical protein
MSNSSYTTDAGDRSVAQDNMLHPPYRFGSGPRAVMPDLPKSQYVSGCGISAGIMANAPHTSDVAERSVTQDNRQDRPYRFGSGPRLATNLVDDRPYQYAFASGGRPRSSVAIDLGNHMDGVRRGTAAIFTALALSMLVSGAPKAKEIPTQIGQAYTAATAIFKNTLCPGTDNADQKHGCFYRYMTKHSPSGHHFK